jgi:hypothetical protein
MPCCLEVEAIRHGRGIVAEAQHITRPKQVQNTISCCPEESETQLGAVQLALQCIVVSL